MEKLKKIEIYTCIVFCGSDDVFYFSKTIPLILTARVSVRWLRCVVISTNHHAKGSDFSQITWEQRKLGEVADSFEYGLNAAAKEFDGANKYIRITDIDDSTHEFLQTDLTSPDTVIEQADNYKLDKGDILFARTGASVGKTYIYKQSDGLVYYAGFLIRARINKKYDPEFIFQNTLTPDYDKYIRIASQRSGQPGVNAQEYADYELMIPRIDEQRKIGKFLRNLDHLITLHQRK